MSAGHEQGRARRAYRTGASEREAANGSGSNGRGVRAANGPIALFNGGDAVATLASLAEFVGVVLRLFDEDLIVPHPEDPRVPAYDFAVLDGDLRRLESW